MRILPFFDELQKISLPSFRVIHVLQSSSKKIQAQQGRIDAKMISSIIPADLQAATFLISGPSMMVRDLEEQLALLGVSSFQIRVERFLGY